MDQYPQPLKSPQERNCMQLCVLEPEFCLWCNNEISTGTHQIDFCMKCVTSRWMQKCDKFCLFSSEKISDDLINSNWVSIRHLNQ